MREKPNTTLIKINDLRQVVTSAEHYSPKRMKIIFSNSEFRLKDIPGIDPRHHFDLKEITKECLQQMDSNPAECFRNYTSRVSDLLDRILAESVQSVN